MTNGFALKVHLEPRVLSIRLKSFPHLKCLFSLKFLQKTPLTPTVLGLKILSFNASPFIFP